MFHDAQDALTPIEDSQEIARAWPSAELIITQGLGHRRALQDGQTIQKTVEFIHQSLKR